MQESINNFNETFAQSAFELLNSLSNEKKNEAMNFLTYLKDKEEWEATMELNSPEILNEIKSGMLDILNNNYNDFNEIRRNV